MEENNLHKYIIGYVALRTLVQDYLDGNDKISWDNALKDLDNLIPFPLKPRNDIENKE